jgi:large subunit ribosomal protein L25
MKQRIELSVETRPVGKHNNRNLRKNKKVPAVVYGFKSENKNIWIAEGDINRYNVRAYENALFNLKSSDSAVNGKVVLMKQVDVHPVSRKPEHVDFYALDLTKAVRINVEIRVEGKPVGIADGGLLNVVNRTIEVECLPTAIPESIVIDVSHLGVGDAFHVSDLKIPAGVKIITAASQTIAVVNMADEEIAAAPAADATAAAAATPAAGAPAAAAGAAVPAKDAAAAPAKDAGKKK